MDAKHSVRWWQVTKFSFAMALSMGLGAAFIYPFTWTWGAVTIANVVAGVSAVGTWVIGLGAVWFAHEAHLLRLKEVETSIATAQALRAAKADSLVVSLVSTKLAWVAMAPPDSPTIGPLPNYPLSARHCYQSADGALAVLEHVRITWPDSQLSNATTNILLRHLTFLAIAKAAFRAYLKNHNLGDISLSERALKDYDDLMSVSRQLEISAHECIQNLKKEIKF